MLSVFFIFQPQKSNNHFLIIFVKIIAFVIQMIYICYCITKNIKSLTTAAIRKPVSFRLKADLIEELKIKAARANRSLNNYVESVLLDDVYDEPNEVTKAAIEEVMSGKNPSKEYTNIDEMFNEILNEA